jgi:hypothetical protein
MMENAFATVRYPLSREEVSAVLADDRGLADEVRHRIQRLARQHLDGSPGYFLFTGLNGLDIAQGEVFTLTLSRMLGRLLPQDASGTLLRRVTDRGVRLGDGRTGRRYSESRDGGYLHTDAPHTLPPLPDYFAMYCVHQAETGGALCLVHGNDLVQRLPEWAVRILKQNFHFDRMLDTVKDPTVVSLYCYWPLVTPGFVISEDYRDRPPQARSSGPNNRSAEGDGQIGCTARRSDPPAERPAAARGGRLLQQSVSVAWQNRFRGPARPETPNVTDVNPLPADGGVTGQGVPMNMKEGVCR